MYYSLPESHKFDTTSYASYLKAKVQTMQDFVQVNLAKSAKQQKQQYDHHTVSHSFKVGDSVWLSILTAGNYSHTGMENELSLSLKKLATWNS